MNCGCGCCCRTVCSDYVTDPCGFFPGHSWITCGSNFAPPHGWSNTGPFAGYRYGGGYGCC
uniref:4Fe-4S ferredoxin-type domain-containing protein n=1 Tax=Mesocestoides corti TaxID=53468 RepID=A0A5K3FKN6_MESCO